MEHIEKLLKEEKGKLEIDFDMHELNFYAVIRNQYGVALINAEGDTLEELIQALSEACVRYMYGL